MPRKLTPRQLAGRMNVKKRRGLTSEGREALRQAALHNRPWEHSTGPRTAAGKVASRWNAHQHGGRARELMPEEFKAYAALVDLAESIAPQGKIINREHLNRTHEAALVAAFSGSLEGFLRLTHLTVRLVAADRLACEHAAIAQGFEPGTLGFAMRTGRAR